MKHRRPMGALIISGVLATFAITTAVLSRAQHKATIAIYPAVSSAGPGATIADGGQTAGQRPLAFYMGNVRASLFSAPQPTLPAPLSRSRVTAEVVKPITEEKEAPSPPDRFANYVYTGTVTVNGQIQALIENSESNEGWYVKPGGSFQGAYVTSIDAQSVTLNIDGKLRLFAKSNEYTVVPLDASAKLEQPDKGGSGQPAPGQAGNGGAGQPATAQPGRGGPGGFGGPGGPGNFGGPGGFGRRGGLGGPGGPGGPGGFGGPGGPGGPGDFGGPPPQ